MKHFTIREFTTSATAQAAGIDNTPTAEAMANIEEMVTTLLDPLRESWAVRCANDQLGTPALKVTSGYRGFRLNDAVGGSTSSAHCHGLAADLVPLNGRLKDFKAFCRAFFAHCKDYDQLISEDEDINGVPRWVHVGYKARDGRQRRQMLSKRAGEKTYTGITA